MSIKTKKLIKMLATVMVAGIVTLNGEYCKKYLQEFSDKAGFEGLQKTVVIDGSQYNIDLKLVTKGQLSYCDSYAYIETESDEHPVLALFIDNKPKCLIEVPESSCGDYLHHSESYIPADSIKDASAKTVLWTGSQVTQLDETIQHDAVTLKVILYALKVSEKTHHHIGRRGIESHGDPVYLLSFDVTEV